MLRDKKGFSMVELIVVIAIMAVLMTILAPQLIRYVNHSRRMRDVSAAGEMVHQIEVLSTYYDSFYDVQNNPGPDGYSYVEWQIDDCLSGGVTEQEWIENYAKPQADGTYNLGGLLIKQFGEIPVSSTNPDYGWRIKYDAPTGKVVNVWLTDTSQPTPVQIELYPDHSAFVN